MLIYYLTGGRMPSKNANSVQIAKMCEAFVQLGHQVTLFARDGDAPAASIPIRFGVQPTFAVETFATIGFRGTRVALLVLRLLMRIRRGSPDLFYSRDLLMLAAAAHLGRPLIFEAHNLPAYRSFDSKLLDYLLRQPNFVRLVCITDSLREKCLASFPSLAPEKALVAASAAAQISPTDDGRLAWPGRPGCFQVGFVGRPFPGKGIEAILAVAALLPHVDFHIVGADAGEVAWTNVQPAPNVHFHGYRTQPELGGYYSRFQCVVAPYGATVMNVSGIESAQVLSSLKIAEYMSSGVPLIASDLPGIREVVSHEVSALLIPPGDVAALGAAIERLRLDPQLSTGLAARARADYLARYTWPARARAVLDGLQ